MISLDVIWTWPQAWPQAGTTFPEPQRREYVTVSKQQQLPASGIRLRMATSTPWQWTCTVAKQVSSSQHWAPWYHRVGALSSLITCMKHSATAWKPGSSLFPVLCCSGVHSSSTESSPSVDLGRPLPSPQTVMNQNYAPVGDTPVGGALVGSILISSTALSGDLVEDTDVASSLAKRCLSEIVVEHIPGVKTFAGLCRLSGSSCQAVFGVCIITTK